MATTAHDIIDHAWPEVETADVAVVVCAYTDERWPALVEAVDSAFAQRPSPREVIVVIDHNPGLLERARRAFDGALVVPNAQARGLSGARNTGVGRAGADIVAFLDDDAQAGEGWLGALLAPFADPSVIGAGGLALPRWQGPRPGWLPPEFLWVVGCSYRGLPETTAAIRNPIGANMAFRRWVVLDAGGFSSGVGRVGRTLLSCEETELSIRAAASTGGTIMHVPAAEVRHRVTDDRVTLSYFRSRCWAEGISKALVGREVGADSALASERSYALRILPTGILNGLGAALRGEPAGLGRAGAIVFGLAVTAAGYARGRLAGDGRA